MDKQHTFEILIYCTKCYLVLGSFLSVTNQQYITCTCTSCQVKDGKTENQKILDNMKRL